MFCVSGFCGFVSLGSMLICSNFFAWVFIVSRVKALTDKSAVSTVAMGFRDSSVLLRTLTDKSAALVVALTIDSAFLSDTLCTFSEIYIRDSVKTSVS